MSDKSTFKRQHDKNATIPVRLNAVPPVGQRPTSCGELRLFVQDRLFVQAVGTIRPTSSLSCLFPTAARALPWVPQPTRELINQTEGMGVQFRESCRRFNRIPGGNPAGFGQWVRLLCRNSGGACGWLRRPPGLALGGGYGFFPEAPGDPAFDARQAFLDARQVAVHVFHPGFDSAHAFAEGVDLGAEGIHVGLKGVYTGAEADVESSVQAPLHAGQCDADADDGPEFRVHGQLPANRMRWTASGSLSSIWSMLPTAPSRRRCWDSHSW